MQSMDMFEILLYSQSGEGQVFSTHPLEIPGLEGERPLTLYLPPDYLLEPEKTYPVAYFFDGQNLYEGQASGPPGWNLHSILDLRYAEGLEVPIAVGIHHGLNRDEELCPWPAEKGQTPRGDALLQWLVEDLHPQLVEQLRIDDRPKMRLVGGASLGGLLALYAGFSHSDFFGKVMAMSPSLWVGNGAIYDYIAEAAFLHNLDFLKLYIDCGALEDDDDPEAWSDEYWEESEDDDDETEDNANETTPTKPKSVATVADANEASGDNNDDPDSHEEDDVPEEEWDTDPLEDAEYLVEILEAKGFEDGEHFLWVPDPEGEHNEWHWSKRLPLALAWLFEDA
ncbi:MAG: alpha/beta hydrolase [Candidatus Sericytochromatia bacterium]